MTNTCRVVVVIPNFNGAEHLPECLDTLRAQDFAEPFETIVSDNGSTDSSLTLLATKYPWTTVLENGSNLGFGAAVNRAAATTSHPYIVVLNNDVRLPPDWLSALVDAADDAAPHVFSIGSQIRLYSHPERLHHRATLVAPIGGGWDVGFNELVMQQDGRGQTAASCGAAMLVRREAFERLGFFDEEYFMYFEDVDLGVRAWMAGLSVAMAPRSVVYHKFGATSGGVASSFNRYWGQRNQLRMAWKLFSLPRLAWVLPLSMLVGSARGLIERRNGASDALGTRWKALTDLWADLDGIMAARRVVQATRKRSDRELRRLGVIASIGDMLREYTRLQTRHGDADTA